MNCDQAINDIIINIASRGSLFYFLVNGLYLGQWGDYTSCMKDTTNGNFILATVNGNFKGDYEYQRGGEGKFVQFSTSIGICLPHVCQ